MNDDEEALPEVASLLAAPRVNGLKLILAALLIAINAFFVIAEYALVRSRRARLEVLRDEGAKGAALALTQLEQRQRVHLRGADRRDDDLDRHRRARRACARGDPRRARSETPSATAWRWRSAVVVAFVLIASAQLVAGEMVPKFYAIDRAEAVARRVARPLRGLQRVVSPVHRGADGGVGPYPAAAGRGHERRAPAAAPRMSSSV